MAVNLHRISTGISSGSSRNGFGNIVSFPSVAPAPFITYYDDFTQVTTTYYTTGKVYGDLIIADRIDATNGSNNITPNELYGGESLRVKYDKFDIFYDGAGAYYGVISAFGVAWAAGTNLWSSESGAYSPFGYYVYIADLYDQSYAGAPNGWYPDGTTRNYLADGNGGFTVTMAVASYYPDQTEIAETSGGDTVYWDGTGAYYI